MARLARIFGGLHTSYAEPRGQTKSLLSGSAVCVSRAILKRRGPAALALFPGEYAPCNGQLLSTRSPCNSQAQEVSSVRYVTKHGKKGGQARWQARAGSNSTPGAIVVKHETCMYFRALSPQGETESTTR